MSVATEFVPRVYTDLANYFGGRKVLVLYGPRRVGKTTLVKHFLESLKRSQNRRFFPYKYVSGDELEVQEVLSKPVLENLIEFCEGAKLLVVDEAQRIPNIGWSIKLLVDSENDIHVILTGSSSFYLAGQVGEPLTGRKFTLTLYPLSVLELRKHFGAYWIKRNLEKLLIFGSYPEVLLASSVRQKRRVLEELVNSYLLKDILELEKVKSSNVLVQLLRLLAFQVGSEVSYNELASSLKIDVKTVARYLDLLEQTFVIFRLYGYSRNLRKEIVKKQKYYFYDLGIRNAIIANTNPLAIRNDVGALWENFLAVERIKKQHYTSIYANNYFWRTWDRKEIDWIEEREGKLFAYEFKYSPEAKVSFTAFLETYPEAKTKVITPDNFLEFVG